MPGALVATGSVRRRAQLAWLRPDLTFTGLRGNIATRLDRVPAGGAVVVAAAALDRLGLADRAAEILDDRASCCPRSGRAPSPSSAGPTTRRPASGLDAIDDAAACDRR